VSSRERLFAAQFLGVAMFLLFLPGVSHSDSSSKGDDCDKSSVLSRMSSEDRDHKFDHDDKSKDADDGRIEDVGFRKHSRDRDDDDDDGGAGAGKSLGSASTGDHADVSKASANVAPVPEPEVIPLLLIGLLFILVRRFLPLIERFHRWLIAPMGGAKLSHETHELEVADR
jgi:hypothetical protein